MFMVKFDVWGLRLPEICGLTGTDMISSACVFMYFMHGVHINLIVVDTMKVVTICFNSHFCTHI